MKQSYRINLVTFPGGYKLTMGDVTANTLTSLRQHGGFPPRPNKEEVHSYLPPSNVLVAFGVVLVAPRSGLCVIVYARVASPLAKPVSTQSL